MNLDYDIREGFVLRYEGLAMRVYLIVPAQSEHAWIDDDYLHGFMRYETCDANSEIYEVTDRIPLNLRIFHT